jgi:protein SCO1/2
MTRFPFTAATRLRPRAALALAGAALALVAAAGCGSSNQTAAQRAIKHPVKSADWRGAVASPPQPAAPLRLRDSVGEPVDLSSYRGKAVLITFIYSHCPDVCPLIVGNLHTAQAELGARAANMQILAVSTDPRGDTPKAVNKFLAAHNMTGRMKYLIGSQAELGRVWKQWNIVANPDKSNPDLVEHSALIYGVAANGKVTTLYPSNFRPADIVHDVPLLAARTT